MTFKQIQVGGKEELVQLIRSNYSMVEEGVEILGGPFGTEEFPPIDLLAKERDGRAQLIFADVKPDENAPIKAAAQIDWFLKNRSLLQQLFPDLCIDSSRPPRAALIYPEFPLLLKRFVRAALPQPPLLYRYRCFEVYQQRFLYLEPCRSVWNGGTVTEKDSQGLPGFRSGVHGGGVEITSEEREAFLS